VFGIHPLLGWLEDITAEFGIPGLRDLGLREERIGEACAKARTASSMKGNPIALTDDELREILRAAM